MNDKILLYKDFRNRDDEFLSCDSLPLLTEGQLRKFIEDKTGCENIEILSDIEAEEYYCDLYKTLSSGVNYDSFSHLGTDKFQAYWKVALEIAKKSLIKR
jgi:hypothetical protein